MIEKSEEVKKRVEIENVGRIGHFYLYAKGHYKKTDLIPDIKKIYAYVYDIPEDMVNIHNVIEVLTRRVWIELHRVGNSEHEFIEWSTGCLEKNWGRFGYYEQDKDPIKAYVHRCMSYLSVSKVRDVMTLPEPSDEVLLHN